MQNAFVVKMFRMFSLFVPPVRHFWSSGTILVSTSIGVGFEPCKTHIFKTALFKRMLSSIADSSCKSVIGSGTKNGQY